MSQPRHSKVGSRTFRKFFSGAALGPRSLRGNCGGGGDRDHGLELPAWSQRTERQGVPGLKRSPIALIDILCLQGKVVFCSSYYPLRAKVPISPDPPQPHEIGASFLGPELDSVAVRRAQPSIDGVGRAEGLKKPPIGWNGQNPTGARPRPAACNLYSISTPQRASGRRSYSQGRFNRSDAEGLERRICRSDTPHSVSIRGLLASPLPRIGVFLERFQSPPSDCPGLGATIRSGPSSNEERARSEGTALSPITAISRLGFLGAV